MPSPETFQRNQDAVVWFKTGDDQRGEPLLAEPVELKVRYERGRSAGFMAQVEGGSYDGILVVDRPIPDGSLVYLGSMDRWLGVGSGSQMTQATLLYQTTRYEEVPDDKGREVWRECRMERFRGKLPGA